MFKRFFCKDNINLIILALLYINNTINFVFRNFHYSKHYLKNLILSYQSKEKNTFAESFFFENGLYLPL
jgi:hypothetical protein